MEPSFTKKTASVLACSGIILLLGFYLCHSSSKVEALKNQLEERDAMIAELRGKAGFLQPGDATLPPSLFMPNKKMSASRDKKLAALQSMETTARQVELRLAHLEKQIKQAGLLPLSREENQQEIERLNGLLNEARKKLAAADSEVARRVVAVPEAIKRLFPNEAMRDPRYQTYRGYFSARIESDYARNLVLDLEGKTGSLSVKSY